MDKEKPNWWPENPYPEVIFPMPKKDYAKIVPDPMTRTALSGMLGREFWDIASETIFDRYKENLEEIDVKQGIQWIPVTERLPKKKDAGILFLWIDKNVGIIFQLLWWKGLIKKYPTFTHWAEINLPEE